MLPEVEIAQALAEQFVERATALKYRGKARDDAALDFFCGAASVAALTGNVALSKHLSKVALLVIAVRGYMGVLELRGISHLMQKHP